MMKFVFTCGGTAGHINPALAVASRIMERCPEAEILFIGAEDNMECELVPRSGFLLKTVRITNISRELSPEGVRHNLHTMKNVLLSVHNARKILQEFQPDAVIGTGGYVCYPVITAAHELRIPTVLHESNAVPGLTTKLLSGIADRILVGVEDAVSAYHDPEKVLVTGTPVRTDFGRYDKETVKAELGLAGKKLIVSVWGSLGAGHINEIFLDLFPRLPYDSDFCLYHVTGTRYHADFMEKLSRTCPDYASRNVYVFDYLHDMAKIMSAADLVVCRSGASTLSELTYMGKPSVLIPSPNVTGNHQEKNARVLERAGAAKVLTESELDPDSLLSVLTSLSGEEGTLTEMAENAAAMSRRDAVSEITDVVFSLISRKGS